MLAGCVSRQLTEPAYNLSTFGQQQSGATVMGATGPITAVVWNRREVGDGADGVEQAVPLNSDSAEVGAEAANTD